MTFPHGGAAQIWRDLEGGSTHNPSKPEIRDWGDYIEGQAKRRVTASELGLIVYSTPQLAAAGTDQTAALNAALVGMTGEFVFDGWIYVTDTITWPIDVIPVVNGEITSGGICLDGAFNSGASVVVDTGIELGAHFEQFHVYVVQPTAPGSRADLVDHPPIVDFSDASRGYINHFRISGATRSIKMVDTGAGSNPGGWNIKTLEIGCYSTEADTWVLNGALDFVSVDTITFWPHGIAGNADQLAIYRDGATTGLKLQRCDGFVADKIEAFSTRIILGESGELRDLPIQISSLSMDGDGADLELAGDRVLIGTLYTTKSGNATSTSITVSGGVHHIAILHTSRTNPVNVIDVTGGELWVHGGRLEQLTTNRRALRVWSGGFASLDGVALNWSDAGPNSIPFIRQDSGAGLRVVNCTMPSGYTNTREVIDLGSDDARNEIVLRLERPHIIDVPSGWGLGRYDFPNQRLQISDSGQAAQHSLRKYGPAEGFDLNFQLAGGTPSSPSIPSVGAVSGDITFGVWTGAAFERGGFIRGVLDAAPSAGVVPVRVDFILEDAAGISLVPMRVRSRDVEIVEGLTLPGLPTYADDAAAGLGGLTAGQVYQTATGELRIKT